MDTKPILLFSCGINGVLRGFILGIIVGGAILGFICGLDYDRKTKAGFTAVEPGIGLLRLHPTAIP